MSTSTTAARLDSLGITLPSPRPPAGAYTPVVIDGDHAYVSGLIALEAGDVAFPGRLGAELDVAQGKLSARGACLQSLGTLANAIGDLDRVERIVKLTGYVRAVPEFSALPPVLDGASELLIEIFGEAGRSARTTVGVAALPRAASVELDLIVRLRPTQP